MIPENSWFEDLEKKIPHGKVRTRFAPSPTGYMHVGGLRTALYAYLIAKKSGGTFILRVEDTDMARYVDGAIDVIFSTLKDSGLIYDEGPDVGGPVAPYTQSERRELYRPYAELLCKRDAAFFCFCEKDETLSTDLNDQSGEQQAEPTFKQLEDDPCRKLNYEASQARADSGEPFVVRLKAPREGETTVSDEVFGDITTPNDTLDDMVLLKRDGMPTYNFANVIDDHLMGITHVLRGSEYITSAPKYNLIYKALGWEIPVYITVSPVMRDAKNKFSKRHGDPTFDDLLNQGYLTDAIMNYVALLGWSPGEEQEIFSLTELTEVFDVRGISKSPAIFDTVKLNHFNSEYIKALSLDNFAKISEPYIRRAVKNESLSVTDIAGILQARLEKLSDIPDKIDFFDSVSDYDTELFVHKKSKTDRDISRDMLKSAKDGISGLEAWSSVAVHDMLIALAESLGVKNATLMWPLRIALAGRAVTPGGAVDICYILGQAESLRRIDMALLKLEETI
ncbi:MAG: glutamate--tRNA ligase [Oscillospiraceae bacterium]|nr:glutamate--tRNA ligase [Oscillospiraceae bacterium]MCL2248331.1 glutamate--tRNA ligase [Oscillospiraceae bacterium]